MNEAERLEMVRLLEDCRVVLQREVDRQRLSLRRDESILLDVVDALNALQAGCDPGALELVTYEGSDLTLSEMMDREFLGI